MIEPGTDTTDYLLSELLRHTRCLVVSLDDGATVTGLECPWGDWSLEALQLGHALPDSLHAVLAATPPAAPQATKLRTRSSDRRNT